MAWNLAALCFLAMQGGWTSYKDPSGISLETPAGWRVNRDAPSGRVQITGAGGEQVVVWPLFIPGPLDTAGASAVLQKLAASLGRSGPWGPAQPAGRAAVRMQGPGGERAAVAALSWIPSPKGSAAFFYALSAPPASYRASQPAFSRILQSFQVTGGAPASSSFQWTRWQDPREGAFSFEIPAGWRIQGGLMRFAPTDIRTAWELLSPDGEIRLTGGDANIPYHTEPNQMLAMTGFREGSWYSPGYGVRMLVRRYIPGPLFAREYVSSRATPGCAPVQISDNRERPDAVSAINAIYARYQGFVSMRLTAGEASFTCQKAGRAMQGYYFAGTMHTQAMGMAGGLWNVEYLYGYLAPPRRFAEAQQVMNHLLQTIQINPQWMAMQQGITANTSQIVSQTANAISETISQSYWSRQQTMDELSRRRSNATLGVVDVIDTATGREIKVENSSNYYWIDHRGTIVGTETYTRPHIDFRELVQLP
jgi:hypothetical protein